MAQLSNDGTGMLDDRPGAESGTVCPFPTRSRHAVFEECVHCGGEMAPEHAHYRCRSCGWRDSCCD
ncbi:MAG: hypothetical protein OER95_08555 [Acidimicrobiia bacterium]|nr:hypothetical protein [Acidimicrobiia bacterium]